MIATEENHVSPFALDVYWSSGRPRDEILEAHLAECARCTAYLASLEAVDVSGGARLGAGTRASSRWGWSLAAAVALAAGFAFVAGRHGPEPTAYVGLKGTPSVELLIHRDERTWIWDDRSPLFPGDALALRVACEGFAHAAVAVPGGTGWTRLSDGACPSDGGEMPFTLRVDSEPGAERVAVVLSRDRLDDRALARAVGEKQRTATVWVVDFVLPKEMKR